MWLLHVIKHSGLFYGFGHNGERDYVSSLLFLCLLCLCLRRHIIGLWPHVMPLILAAESPWATQTHCSFCRGSQGGCRVHDTQQSGTGLPHHPAQLHTCWACLRDLNLIDLNWSAVLLMRLMIICRYCMLFAAIAVILLLVLLALSLSISLSLTHISVISNFIRKGRDEIWCFLLTLPPSCSPLLSSHVYFICFSLQQSKSVTDHTDHYAH